MKTFKRVLPLNQSIFSIKEFQDVILVSPEQNVEYRTNRTLLAQFSPYFRSNLNQKLTPGSVLRFELKKDPKNATKIVLDAILTSKLVLNKEIASAVLCVSSIYGITKYCDFALEIIKNDLDLNSNFRTTAKYLTEFQEYDLIKYFDVVLVHYAKYFNMALSDENFTEISLEELLEVITDGRFLAEILIYLKKTQNLSTQSAIHFIEIFYSNHPNISEEEKRYFTKKELINMNDINTYRLLTKFDCLWLEASVSRKYLSYLFSNRRRIINECKPLDKVNTETVNRWYALSYVAGVQDLNNSHVNNNNINMIEFITTLGGRIKQLDPEQYMLFNNDQSIIPRGDDILGIEYKHSNIFMKNDKFFCAVGDRQTAVVDFGHQVTASSIILDFNILARKKVISGVPQQFPYPKQINIQFFSGKTLKDQKTFNVDSSFFRINYVNMSFTKIIVSPTNPRSTFKLKNIEIIGQFI